MTTQLTVVERASVALGSSALEIHLTDLAKKHADITAIANKDGREQGSASKTNAPLRIRCCLSISGAH